MHILLICYNFVIICCLVYLVIYLLSKFDKNKYYFMPFPAPTENYYYPEWKENQGISTTFSDKNNIKHTLFGFISKPIDEIKLDDTIILYFHGNAGNIYLGVPKYLEMIEKLGPDNYIIVSFDYRGYGLSTGYPTSEGILEDSCNMVMWCQKQFPQNKIIYYGESIGTSLAAYVSFYRKPDGIILKSPFTSMYSLIADIFHLPHWIIKKLIPTDFLTFEWLISAMKKKIPIIIFYNKDDNLIPKRNIYPLLNLFESIELDGCHNDCKLNDKWIKGCRQICEK